HVFSRRIGCRGALMRGIDLLRPQRAARRRRTDQRWILASGAFSVVVMLRGILSATDSVQDAMLKLGGIFSGWSGSLIAGYLVARYRRRVRLRRLGWLPGPARIAVSRPPGAHTLVFLSAWSRRKTMERIVRPLVADMQ